MGGSPSPCPECYPPVSRCYCLVSRQLLSNHRSSPCVQYKPCCAFDVFFSCSSSTVFLRVPRYWYCPNEGSPSPTLGIHLRGFDNDRRPVDYLHLPMTMLLSPVAICQLYLHLFLGLNAQPRVAPRRQSLGPCQLSPQHRPELRASHYTSNILCSCAQMRLGILPSLYAFCYERLAPAPPSLLPTWTLYYC